MVLVNLLHLRYLKSAKAVTAFLLSSFIMSISFGQNFEPLDLTKMVFYEDTTIDVNLYSTGLFKATKQIPYARNVLKGVSVDFTLLYRTEKKAIVELLLTDSTGLVTELYFHLKKDSKGEIEG